METETRKQTQRRLSQQVEVLLENPDAPPFCVIPPHYFELKLHNPARIEHSPLSVERYSNAWQQVH